jgi:hypothetical protein
VICTPARSSSFSSGSFPPSKLLLNVLAGVGTAPGLALETGKDSTLGLGVGDACATPGVALGLSAGV